MTFGRWLLIHSLSISIVVMLGVGYFYKEELKLEKAYAQLLQLDMTEKAQQKIAENSKTTHDSKDRVVIGSAKSQETPVLEKITKNTSKTVTLVRKTEPSTLQQDVTQTLNNIEAKSLDEQDYLLKARAAYWDKNYPLAIELYTNEINKTPEVADLYGELGNIYYSLQNYEVASVHYLKAGELLLKSNEQDRAKQIYDILMSVSPDKAQVLLNQKNEQYQ